VDAVRVRPPEAPATHGALLVKPIECASKKRNIVQLLLAPSRPATASLQQRCACTPAPFAAATGAGVSRKSATFAFNYFDDP